MAFSQESGVQTASTAAALRAYDGGVLTLVGGTKTMQFNIAAANAVVGMANSSAKTYRLKLSASSDMSNPTIQTVTVTPSGSSNLPATSYTFTGLTDGTQYWGTVALDNS